PTAQSGTAFNVTVNPVDAHWNLVSSIHTVGITSSDSNATLPANAALVAGTKTFSVTFKTVGSWTVTATDLTDGTKTANTSPAIAVNAGAFVKLQLLAPGETASPGSATGKTGAPSAQTANTGFNVTVNAVDANWNVVSSVTDTVGITSTDATALLPSNAALVAGTKSLTVIFGATGSFTLTASDITDGSKTANTSPAITVNTAQFTPATGGGAISADTVGGTFTTLTGPTYSENANGNVGTGTIILNVPSGFIFDTGGTAPTL